MGKETRRCEKHTAFFSESLGSVIRGGVPLLILSDGQVVPLRAQQVRDLLIVNLLTTEQKGMGVRGRQKARRGMMRKGWPFKR